MSEMANGASRQHIKDADNLHDRNFLFLLSELRGRRPLLQACLYVWEWNTGFVLRGQPTHPNAIFNICNLNNLFAKTRWRRAGLGALSLILRTADGIHIQPLSMRALNN